MEHAREEEILVCQTGHERKEGHLYGCGRAPGQYVTGAEEAVG